MMSLLWITIQSLKIKIKIELLQVFNRPINLEGRVFANDPGDLGLKVYRVISKTPKMVLDTALSNIQHCKVRIKGKMEESREKSSALPYTLGKRKPSGRLRLLIYIYIYIYIYWFLPKSQ